MSLSVLGEAGIIGEDAMVWHWIRQMTPMVMATISITVTIVICSERSMFISR